MAADLNALRTALGRLGLSQIAATHITDADGQGFATLGDFRYLSDTEVENLCRAVRKPGGSIPNPNPGAGAPANIPNPGIPVPTAAENNLKRMCYFLRHRERTSRDTTAPDITLENIRGLIGYRRWEDNHDDPAIPDLTFRDWTRTIETIEDFFRGYLGSTKIPLAYVLREDRAVPANDPEGGYPTIQDELIARAPHHDGNNPPTFVQAYKDDNVRVFELIASMTRDKDCWTYVQKASRTRDGRMAFYGLKNHYLGTNNVDNMASKAENKLKNTTYTGEQRRWNFEKYVKIHVDQHDILEGLTRHGYAGIDPRSKVRFLLDGIKTKELDSVKAMIWSSADLRSDFDACVNLCQDFIAQNVATRTSNISAVHVTKPQPSDKGNDWDKVQPDMTVEDRFYKRDEYAKLSIAKKKGLAILREKRGHKRGDKAQRQKNNNRNFNKRVVKVVKRLLKDDDDDHDNDSSSDSDDDNKPKGKTVKRKKV